MASFGFGAAAASSQSLFGAPASSQSLFGAPAAQPSLFGGGQSQAQSAPSLFGAPQQQAAPGSLFGAPQQQSAPSLFGAPQQQSAPSLFGAPQQQAAPGSFGAPQQQAAPGSLFGAPQQQSGASLFGAPASSQSLFGAPASSQSLFGAPASSQSLFGAASSQSLFGAQPQQAAFGQQQQAAFGQQQQAAFGQQQQAAFGQQQQAAFGQQQQAAFGQQQQQQAQPAQLPRALTELVDRLNPLHSESRMHAALYNVVPPSDISRYSRSSFMDERLWDSAVSNNPDPSRMVPVQANNFDDLLRRSDMQAGRLAEHGAVLSRIEEALTNFESDVETEVATKLAAYRRRHRELARKLLRLAGAVEVAAASGESGAMLSQAEVERKRRLDGIARALAAPAEFKDKLSDLVELAEGHVLDRRANAAVEIRDARAAAAVKSLLADQLSGIQHLANVCERTDRDVDIMANAVTER